MLVGGLNERPTTMTDDYPLFSHHKLISQGDLVIMQLVQSSPL